MQSRLNQVALSIDGWVMMTIRYWIDGMLANGSCEWP